MTKKADFSKDEWQMITDGPEWILAALAAADGNVALTTKSKESSAFKKVIKDYRSRSELVAEVVDDKTKTSKATKSATLSDAEQALEEINDLLDAKATSADASDYRKFLTSIADSVAEAAGEGALGIGKKLSDKEAKALTKIKAALKPGKAPAAKPSSKPAAKPAARPGSRPARPGMKLPTRAPRRRGQGHRYPHRQEKRNLVSPCPEVLRRYVRAILAVHVRIQQRINWRQLQRLLCWIGNQGT